MVVVVPVDADIDEAEDIACEYRCEACKRGPFGTMRDLQLQHHDGDNDRDDTVAERGHSFFGHDRLRRRGACSQAELITVVSRKGSAHSRRGAHVECGLTGCGLSRIALRSVAVVFILVVAKERKLYRMRASGRPLYPAKPADNGVVAETRRDL